MCKLNNKVWLTAAGGMVVLASLSLATTSIAQLPPVTSSPETAKGQVEHFADFEKALQGAALVGHFVVTGDKETELKQERYELENVRHVKDNQWLFSARIQYGDHDVTLPLTLLVKWAGDTPVITVDNLSVPGLGTFTARVMIYADHYAGFWSGGGHGGHLFGVIEREDASEKTSE